MSNNNRSINAAVYIAADPLTFNDVNLIRSTIKMFNFACILLDRQNKDTMHKRYYLNCTDRMNIINHNLKQEGLIDYKIIPVDTTVKQAISDNDITTLVLNFDQQQSTNFKHYGMLHKICPNLEIVMTSVDKYVDSHDIMRFIDFDHSMQECKKYCSEYAFSMLKIKNTKKICLTGNFGTDYSEIENVLRENYLFIDVDEHIMTLFSQKDFIADVQKEMKKKKNSIAYIQLFSQSASMNMQCIISACAKDDKIYRIFEKHIFRYINQEIAKRIVGNYNDEVVIKFSMAYEFAMEKMFDYTICVTSTEEERKELMLKKGIDPVFIKDLIKIQQDINEKAGYADYVVSSCKDQVQMNNNAHKLLNHLKKINKQ